jgi:hypothetical protein
MPTYKVKENNHIQKGNRKSKEGKKVYGPGDSIELSVEEAAAIPHALELSDTQAAKLEKVAEKEPSKK